MALQIPTEGPAGACLPTTDEAVVIVLEGP